MVFKIIITTLFPGEQQETVNVVYDEVGPGPGPVSSQTPIPLKENEAYGPVSTPIAVSDNVAYGPMSTTVSGNSAYEIVQGQV